MNRIAVTLFALTLCVPTLPARAAPSFDGCEYDIVSLPAVLTSPGVWCLRANRATSIASGSAITVAVNGVTLDCNGFRLSGLGAGTATTTVGIRAGNKLNTTIRDCTVRGFHTGVRIDGGGGALVESNRIEASTVVGIVVDSDEAVVRHNVVTDTGGSTAGPSGAQGISAFSTASIVDNTIAGVAPVVDGSNGIGIYVSTAPYTSVLRNRVSGVAKVTSGDAWGILIQQSGGSVADSNHVVGPNMTTAILCGASTMAAVRNVTTGSNAGVSGCLSSGNLNVVPN